MVTDPNVPKYEYGHRVMWDPQKPDEIWQFKFSNRQAAVDSGGVCLDFRRLEDDIELQAKEESTV